MTSAEVIETFTAKALSTIIKPSADTLATSIMVNLLETISEA